LYPEYYSEKGTYSLFKDIVKYDLRIYNAGAGLDVFLEQFLKNIIVTYRYKN